MVYVVSVEHPILIEDYQRKRIVDFIEGNKSEEVDMTDAGTYQQAYAVQAIGSGQLTGKGLNNNDTSSLKNAGYIAEAQNDFIFAVIGEELGFTGGCITIFLLFLIVLECIIVAVRAKNFEGRLICCGVAIYIGFQTFINIGVVSWILPNTGVPLPFLAVVLRRFLHYSQLWELYSMSVFSVMLKEMMTCLQMILEDNFLLYILLYLH